MFFAIIQFVLLSSIVQPNFGFNHFLKCSSMYIHVGPWEIELYDLINEVSGTLKATEEKRNISCISYAGAMCLNATCRVDSHKSYLGYHHCVFNGEYDFCERFTALCESQNGHGGCDLCDDHHCNAPPAEEREKGAEQNAEGQEKHGENGENAQLHEMETKKMKMNTKSAAHSPMAHLSADANKVLVTTKRAELTEKKGAQQQQRGNVAAGGNTFWDTVFFFGVFVACVMLAFVGYRELRKKGFFGGEGTDENLI